MTKTNVNIEKHILYTCSHTVYENTEILFISVGYFFVWEIRCIRLHIQSFLSSLLQTFTGTAYKHKLVCLMIKYWSWIDVKTIKFEVNLKETLDHVNTPMN